MRVDLRQCGDGIREAVHRRGGTRVRRPDSIKRSCRQFPRWFRQGHPWSAFVGILIAGCAAACRAELPTFPDEKDDKIFFLTHDERERRYIVHRPASWDGKSRVPVVLAFHGGTGRAEVQRAMSRMNATADRHGFLVIYPDGTGPELRLGRKEVPILTWNAGRCCGYAAKQNVDDVGFVRALIDRLMQQYPIDESRIYATGFSNGAMFVHRLGVELSDRLAAIAPVSGALMVDAAAPKRPISVLHIHGLKDPNAKYEGGPGRVDRTVHRSIPDTLAWWIKANRCPSQPVETREDKDFIVERFAPSPDSNGATVVLVKLPEGGHTWPGGIDTMPQFKKGALIQSVDASEMIWKFFEDKRR